MKKLLVVTLALSIAGMAAASTLAVPWFVDNSAAAAKFPPEAPGTMGIVYLHNNKTAVLTCSIEYFTQGGVSVGPAAPDNTFVIQPQASLAFRPVASDPASDAGGQEATDAGWLVPDRPLDGVGNDGKKNGSLVVTWLGDGTDVQGVYIQEQYVGGTVNNGKLTSIAYLLPAGA